MNKEYEEASRQNSWGRCFMACLIAGCSASPIAVVLWSLVLWVHSVGVGGEMTVGIAGFIAVAFMSLAGGLILALLVGFPVLVAAEYLGVNRMPVLAAIGAVLGLAVGVAGSWPKEAALLYVFLGLLGALCGAIASAASKPPQHRTIGQ